MTFQIRARFNQNRVTVYQGHTPEIAEASIEAGRLMVPTNTTGNLWITMSFLDAMRDSDWAMRDGQHRILALNMSREGFEWILSQAAPGHFDPAKYTTVAQWERAVVHSPVRIQWDQAIGLDGTPAGWMTPRLGLALEARDRFLTEWVSHIADVTPHVWKMHQFILDGDIGGVEVRLPEEHVYPLRDALRAHLGLVA